MMGMMRALLLLLLLLLLEPVQSTQGLRPARARAEAV
jgi:hypothetical protein